MPFCFSPHRFRHLPVEHLSSECFLCFLSWLQSLNFFFSPNSHLGCGNLYGGINFKSLQERNEKATVSISSSPLLITRQMWKEAFYFPLLCLHFTLPSSHQRLGWPTEPVLEDAACGGSSLRARWCPVPSRLYLHGCHIELLVRGLLYGRQSP